MLCGVRNEYRRNLGRVLLAVVLILHSSNVIGKLADLAKYSFLFRFFSIAVLVGIAGYRGGHTPSERKVGFQTRTEVFGFFGFALIEAAADGVTESSSHLYTGFKNTEITRVLASDRCVNLLSCTLDHLHTARRHRRDHQRVRQVDGMNDVVTAGSPYRRR